MTTVFDLGSEGVAVYSPVAAQAIDLNLYQRDGEGVAGSMAHASILGSIIPATWNFMLAARARGIGTAWTTLHLMHEKEIAEMLGIPYDEYMQIAMIPIAYTKGTNFKPAYRPDVQSVMHFNNW